MKYLIQKDLKSRISVKRFEVYKQSIKTILFTNGKLIAGVRESAFKRTTKSPVFNGRIKNRCIYTGRSHSTYRFAHLSRIKLREMSCNSSLPGVIKSSW